MISIGWRARLIGCAYAALILVLITVGCSKSNSIAQVDCTADQILVRFENQAEWPTEEPCDLVIKMEEAIRKNWRIDSVHVVGESDRLVSKRPSLTTQTRHVSNWILPPVHKARYAFEVYLRKERPTRQDNSIIRRIESGKGIRLEVSGMDIKG